MLTLYAKKNMSKSKFFCLEINFSDLVIEYHAENISETAKKTALEDYVKRQRISVLMNTDPHPFHNKSDVESLFGLRSRSMGGDICARHYFGQADFFMPELLQKGNDLNIHPFL